MIFWLNSSLNNLNRKPIILAIKSVFKEWNRNLENGLVGVFEIVMNEEASILKIDNKPFTLPKGFSLDTFNVI